MGSVTSAKLRLFVTDASKSGGSVFATGSGWTETGTTWNNAPGPVGSALATAGAAPAGQWVEYNVTSAVQAGNVQLPPHDDLVGLADRQQSRGRPGPAARHHPHLSGRGRPVTGARRASLRSMTGTQELLDTFDIRGRTAIVTGGSQGIGRAIALGFASVGANVVVASRKADACAATVAEITAAGGSALVGADPRR